MAIADQLIFGIFWIVRDQLSCHQSPIWANERPHVAHLPWGRSVVWSNLVMMYSNAPQSRVIQTLIQGCLKGGKNKTACIVNGNRNYHVLNFHGYEWWADETLWSIDAFHPNGSIQSKVCSFVLWLSGGSYKRTFSTSRSIENAPSFLTGI